VAELNDAGQVRAAGGVVWRRRDEGGVEVLVVHRPRHRDWSLPKGKARPGESDEECALREVEEETGLQCRLVEELPGASYRDAQGRPKAVRYWAMVPTGGELVVHGEVDDVRWLSSEEAAGVLTYERDRAVVASLGAPPGERT
jgi:8-oxo-dGTP pyrophosphatase MutT (NUDIX family)